MEIIVSLRSTSPHIWLTKRRIFTKMKLYVFGFCRKSVFWSKMQPGRVSVDNSQALFFHLWPIIKKTGDTCRINMCVISIHLQFSTTRVLRFSTQTYLLSARRSAQLDRGCCVTVYKFLRTPMMLYITSKTSDSQLSGTRMMTLGVK